MAQQGKQARQLHGRTGGGQAHGIPIQLLQQPGRQGRIALHPHQRRQLGVRLGLAHPPAQQAQRRPVAPVADQGAEQIGGGLEGATLDRLQP
ncbi:MAG: hypothetical protein ACKOPS_00880, partial [Cyanobium sp.]